VSGIGADATSQSLYVRKRGEDERVVRAAFVDSVLIRPAVFGPYDAFLTTILKLLRQLPTYPMFGHGLTAMQPAYVKDMAEAIARALQGTETMRRHMSVAVLTSTLTRNFSERSRTKPASSPYSFQSHLQFGMCWHGYRKWFRVCPSLGLKWN
jgi:uncharacterized protein YbjT (DUF2867 family)